MEQLVQRVEQAPNPHAGHLLVFDLSGTTLSKFFWAWTYIREGAHMGQAYYPEVLGKLCFVRAFPLLCLLGHERQLIGGSAKLQAQRSQFLKWNIFSVRRIW